MCKQTFFYMWPTAIIQRNNITNILQTCHTDILLFVLYSGKLLNQVIYISNDIYRLRHYFFLTVGTRLYNLFCWTLLLYICIYNCIYINITLNLFYPKILFWFTVKGNVQYIQIAFINRQMRNPWYLRRLKNNIQQECHDNVYI